MSVKVDLNDRWGGVVGGEDDGDEGDDMSERSCVAVVSFIDDFTDGFLEILEPLTSISSSTTPAVNSWGGTELLIVFFVGMYF